MNDREKAALKKLSLLRLQPNVTKALLHMLSGGTLHSCPVVPGSLERVITDMKDHGLIEKVDGKYRLCAEYAGIFAVDFEAQKRAARAQHAQSPAELPAPAVQPPSAPANPAPAPASVQPAQDVALKPAAPEKPLETAMRFVGFSPQARKFLQRPKQQHQRVCRTWFELGYVESDGQRILDAVSDLAAGQEPVHKVDLDRMLQIAERLASTLFSG